VIVTCEQCETQFQLDDSKVPEGGIRVRCSRCKRAFFVESPHRPDIERADDLAREALAPDSAAAATDRELNALGLEDGESDWQFNEEIDRAPVRDDGMDDLAAAQEAVDDLLGAGPSGPVDPVTGPDDIVDPGRSDFDVSVDLGGSDLVGSDDPGDLDLDDSIDLGGSDLDDSIDLGGSDLDGSIDLGGSDLDGSIDLDSSDLDLTSEPAEDPNAVTTDRGFAVEGAAPEAQPALAAPAEASLAASGAPDTADVSDDRLTEFGSSDEWDLLVGKATPKSSVSGTPIGRLSRRIPEEATASVRGDADDIAFDADAWAVPIAAWILRVRSSVGWVLVGLLCAYAGVVGLWPGFSASEPVLGARPVAGLEAGDVRGRWIENAVAGPIYVISGELRAAPSATLPTGSVLRIRLLDAAGVPISAESAAVGPLVSAEQLREWDLRDLRELQEARTLRLAWAPLAAGARRPFHAILGGVPAAAAAFEFRVAAAAGPAPEPDAGAITPYPAPALAAEAMIE
jgi:predicted Zn finger-like uncharacterized protein